LENVDKVLKMCAPIVDVLCMVDGDKSLYGFLFMRAWIVARKPLQMLLIMWKLITRRYGGNLMENGR
jgi:hypothetical protein